MARPRAIASLAFCASSGVGPTPNVFPINMDAIPQVAIAQFGSTSSTSRNAFSPSCHENECSSATARSKRGCTLASHEVGKTTLPSCSGAFSCASAAAALKVARRHNKVHSFTVFIVASSFLLSLAGLRFDFGFWIVIFVAKVLNRSLVKFIFSHSFNHFIAAPGRLAGSSGRSSWSFQFCWLSQERLDKHPSRRARPLPLSDGQRYSTSVAADEEGGGQTDHPVSRVDLSASIQHQPEPDAHFLLLLA